MSKESEQPRRKFPRQVPAGRPPTFKSEAERTFEQEIGDMKKEHEPAELLAVLSDEMRKAGNDDERGLQATIEEHMVTLEKRLLDQIRAEENDFDTPSEKVEYLRAKHALFKHKDFEATWRDPPPPHRSFQNLMWQVARRINYRQKQLPPADSRSPEAEDEPQPEQDARTPGVEPFRWQKTERLLVYLFEALIKEGYLSHEREADSLWVKVAKSFANEHGEPYDNQQLAKQKQNYLNNKTAKPKGADKIDALLSGLNREGD